MAGLNIQITIGADDKASGPLGKIKNALSGVSDNAKKGFSGLQGIISTGLVGAASVGVGAVLGIGAAAFTVSQDVSDTAAAIQSDLGTTADEANRFADIAANAWGNNFFESMQDAGAAVADVRKQLGDMPDDELQRAAENAARLGDSFELDAGESINTVKTLMEEFGLTSDQAFDFITTGMQKGLNANGDFVDSIGEYSNLFSEAGFDADEFFSIMESGQQGGVLGTDKIADSIKEMGIILGEGGDDVESAFDLMGLSYDDIADKVSTGEADWADYFDQIVGGLADIDDPIARQAAQVDLFGTMAEDMGTSFTDALRSSTTAIEDMSGATGSLDTRYNTMGDAIEGFKRRGLLALQPIGDVLLDLANRIMPHIEEGFAFLETNIVPVIETVADVVSSFVGNLEEGMSPLDAFIEAIWDLAPQSVLDGLIQLRDELLPQLAEWFTSNVQPIIDMVGGFVEWNDVLMAVGVVIAATVLPALAGIVVAAAPVIAVGALLVGAIALARTAWENDWGGIQGKVETVKAWFEITIPLWLENLRLWWEENGTAIMAVVETAWAAIQSVVETAWSVITEIFAAFRAAFEGDWEAFGTHLGTAFGEAWLFIQEALATAGPLLIEKLAGIVLNLIDTIKSTDWKKLGKNIIDGISEGVTAAAGKLYEAARTAVTNAVIAAKAAMGIESPSKVAMVQIGQPITEGIALGMMQTSPIEDAVNRLSSAIFTPLSPDSSTPATNAVTGSSGNGNESTTIYQIDARGASITESQIEASFERALRKSGRHADSRMRV